MILRMLSKRESKDWLINMLASKQVTPENILMFGMTSKSNHSFIIKWVATNLHLLSNPRHFRFMWLLENVMSCKDDQAKQVAELTLTHLGLQVDYTLDAGTVKRLVAAIHNSGYVKPQHEKIVCGNAAYCGQHESLRLLTKNELPLPKTIEKKITARCLKFFESGDELSAENYLRTMRVITETNLQKALKKIKEKIKSHAFVLNGGGDNSIAEIGHPVTTHAAKVFKIADTALKSDKPLIGEYKDIANSIINELSITVNKGWFTSRGERDTSTTACYSALIRMVTEGSGYLHEYNNLVEQIHGADEDSDEMELKM